MTGVAHRISLALKLIVVIEVGTVTESNPRHIFEDDRPIKSAREDMLGRRGFADGIARAIRSWDGHESLIVGIYGPWGSGKTSVLNMIAEALKAEPEGERFFRLFNPWEVGDRSAVNRAFFDEVGAALGKADPTGEGQLRLAKWTEYSTRLDILAASAGGSAAILGAQGSLPPALAALLLGGVAFAGVVKASRAALEARLEIAKRNLDDIRVELRGLMGSLERPVVVIMDDLDRLEPLEVAQMIQLVKANGDFPKLVFVLAFQRDVVESALQAAIGVDGSSFLEKVVQVSIDLPAIARSKLDELVDEGLHRVLPFARDAAGPGPDERRWRRLYLSGMREYLTTLRSVKRYLATLAFYRGLFQAGDQLEVNPVDFAVLEALRVFEPAVYHGLCREKELLTGGAFATIFDQQGVEPRYQSADAIRKAAPEGRWHQVETLLANLFPAYGCALRREELHGDPEDWQREKRVCSTTFFDRYFCYALSEGDVSEQELSHFISLTPQIAELRVISQELLQRDLLTMALGRLVPRVDEIPNNGVTPFLTLLFDVGDALEAKEGNEYPWASGMAEHILAERLLSRVRNESVGEAWVLPALQASIGMIFPVRFAARLRERSEDAEEQRGRPLLSARDADRVCAVSLERLRSAAKDGGLGNRGSLLWLLFRWRDLTGSFEEPRAWVAAFASEPTGALRLVASALHFETRSGPAIGDEEQIPAVNLDEIGQFVDLAEVAKLLGALDQSELSERDRVAIMTFAAEWGRRLRRRRPAELVAAKGEQ